MLDTVKVIRTSNPTYDTTTLVASVGTLTTVYQGPGRVAEAAGNGIIQVGDEIMDTRLVTVYLPYNVPIPQRDDIVLVVTDQSDTDMTARALKVLDVNGGGLLRMVREVSCTSYHGSRYWVQ